MKKIIAIVTLVFLTVSSYAHEYHVSIINFDYNKDSSSIEATLKVNTKDLNSVLTEIYKKNPKLKTENEIEQTDSLINDYISKNINIKVNTTAKQYSYIGYEHDEEFTYIYIEYKQVESVRTLYVFCTLLNELGVADHGHSHQSNLININISGETKSLYLNPKKKEATIEF